jgi:hypothetical protein
LINCLRFYVPLKKKITYVTIAGEGLQNSGLCSALRAFEQGGIFIVPHLLVFPVSSEGPPHSVAYYDTRIYSNRILTGQNLKEKKTKF